MDSSNPAAALPANDKLLAVDPFLVEALQNPRHRLTILRMELDIQRFLQNPDQQQFEFQHFPTSYLRLAAHRVAQHYGLVTMVLDTGLDGVGNRILAKRMSEIRYPAVRLYDIPLKQSESDKTENIKIAIKPRPNKGCTNEVDEIGIKRSPVRTVEERKEDYDRARARIFSGPGSPNADNCSTAVPMDRKNLCLSREETEGCKNSLADSEKNSIARDGGSTSRVAIFKDREKDRSDPDYDRSYERYVRNLPANQGFGLAPFSMQKIQLPTMQYDAAFGQLGQLPRTQNSINYRPPPNPVVSPFCAMGLNQTPRDGVYMQWPSASMMYAHSYEQFRHAVFQTPFCHQPLSCDYSQNH